MAESTLVRLYKRGDESIDLDALLKRIKVKKDLWLSNFKPEDRAKAEESLSRMVLALDSNDGSLVYQPGEYKFDNTLGFTDNSDSKINNYVAGFIGNLIRAIDAYRVPVKEEEPQEETPTLEETPVKETPSEEASVEETPVTPVYNNENDYLNAQHPRATSIPNFIRNLNPHTSYDKNDKIILSKALQSMPKENLFKLIAIGMSKNPSDKELNQTGTIVKAFNGVAPNFLNNYILKMALEIGRLSNYYHQFDNNPNLYYIPFNNLESIGAVYEIDPNGLHKFYFMDKRDIPFYMKLWHNDFMTQIPSQKNGGIIKKFAPGGKANIVLSDSYDWRKNIFSKFQLNLINLLEAIHSDTSLTDLEKAAKKLELINTWNSMQERHYKIMGNWDKVSSIRPDDNSVLNYQTDIIKDYSFINNAIGDSLNDFRKINGNTLNLDAVNKWNPDNRGEGFTYARTLFGTTDTLKEDDPFWESVKKYGITHNTKEGFGNYNFLSLELNLSDVPNNDKPTDNGHSDAWNKIFGGKKYIITEDYPNIIPDYNNKGNFWGLMLDLMGVGRPIYSTFTNNRVSKVLGKPLVPQTKLYVQELHQITGDLGNRLLHNSLAANVRRNANNTASYEKNISDRLERERYANDLIIKGALVDNLKIERNMDIAELKATKSMYNRVDAANYFNESLYKTNREKAELEASRLKSNWKTWDNYWGGLESRFRSKLEDRVESANSFYDNIEALQAENLYKQFMKDADSDLYAWMNLPENKNKDITDWHLYTLYAEKKQEARNRANSIIYSGYSSRHNLSYDNPYKDTNNLFFSRGWNGAKLNF